MKSQFYVQEIAGNYLKNLIDDPKEMKVNSRFLRDAEYEQFKEGFLALLALVRNLYSDIICEPAGFGMMLKENIETDAKNTAYTNSNASFVRIPNLLFVLGVTGELQPDSSLIIDGQTLLAAAKELKITSLPFILEKFKAYGFEIAGFHKTVKPGDTLNITYPDSRFLIVALKSMAETQLALNKGDLKKNKNYFYMLHNGLLENETVKAPKLTVETIYHTLSEDKREHAAVLHDIAAPFAKPAVRMGGFMRNDWSCVYTGNKNKKVLMSLQVVQDKLSVKLNLHNIGKYTDQIMDFSDDILETIRTNGWACGHCNDKCGGGFAFEMDGEAYNKCRCGTFVFDVVSDDVTSYCAELLKLELNNQD